MAVATSSLRRRKNEEAKVAAKSKRDKMLLIGGSVVLVAVLAFEVPKLMHTLGGSSSSAPAPAVTPVATPGAAAAVPGVVTPSEIRADFKQIASLPSKDPFKAQLDTVASTTGTQPWGKAPAVRTSHFKSKDPFKVQLGEVEAAPMAPLASPVPVSSPGPVKHKSSAAGASSHGFIVILRSLDTKASGQSEVRKAHAHGLSTAALLFSSKYTTLRHGYWVVYLDKYATAAQADAALKVARANGYTSAYRRPVRK